MDNMTPKERGILAGLANRDFFSANPYKILSHLEASNMEVEWRQGFKIGKKLLEVIERFRDE